MKYFRIHRTRPRSLAEALSIFPKRNRFAPLARTSTDSSPCSRIVARPVRRVDQLPYRRRHRAWGIHLHHQPIAWSSNLRMSNDRPFYRIRRVQPTATVWRARRPEKTIAGRTVLYRYAFLFLLFLGAAFGAGLALAWVVLR